MKKLFSVILMGIVQKAFTFFVIICFFLGALSEPQIVRAQATSCVDLGYDLQSCIGEYADPPPEVVDGSDPNYETCEYEGWTFYCPVDDDRIILSCGSVYSTDEGSTYACRPECFERRMTTNADEFCCGWPLADGSCSATNPMQTVGCGTSYSAATMSNYTCRCYDNSNRLQLDGYVDASGQGSVCCGWVGAGGQNCYGSDQAAEKDEDFDETGIEDGATSRILRQLNPLTNEKVQAPGVEVEQDITTIGGIISRVLFFAFPLAGLILFVMLFWGGFEIVSGAAGKKSMDAGRQRITAAVVGFLLLFVSYWLIQLVGLVFGIKIF